MTIQVGHNLDQYEILEEVGHGGMAVVYRGLDTNLRREVAVKVLHRHLADDAESRSRFEREAQAVAKLRHDNILEIFDFSGLESKESYIVTEFISGQTLKDFISHYRIRFPETGVMIALQVLKALEHAHGAGVLHRDIKPENIMIRGDGVIKLMDFGIAQMLDLQRMTVTGQLLGSPAYMSPEHLSGGQLDFRTDVFSAGTLLYQLVVGELPFRGKNPHEILKRVAECDFVEPVVASPIVGDELSGIIGRALASEKSDRFADVASMRRTLEDYLRDSGIDDPREELACFFDNPMSYEMALEPRLIDAWVRRGQRLWGSQRNKALGIFNRVLTVQPDHVEVHSALSSLSRWRRRRLLAVGIAGVATIVGASVLAKGNKPVHRPAPEVVAAAPATTRANQPELPPGGMPPPIRPAAGGVADAGPTILEPDSRPRADPGHKSKAVRARAAARRRALRDAGTPARRMQLLQVFPQRSEIRIGGGAWQQMDARSITVEVPSGVQKIEIRNPACCQSKVVPVAPDGTLSPIKITLPYLPASVVPSCGSAATVTINGKPARMGTGNTILLGDTLRGSRAVIVEFIGKGGSGIDTQSVDVRYRETKIVKCAL